MNDQIRNLFWRKIHAGNGVDEKLEVKTVSLDPNLMFMFTVIDSGMPERALNRLRELESQMLNKPTLSLYLEALEQIVATSAVVKKLLQACEEDQKRQGHAANN